MGSVALRDALNNARRRLEGVEGHYIPTIADVVGSLAQQQDESAAARAELAHVASLIDEADLEAFECEDERAKLVALGELEGLRERLARARASLRAALLRSKKRNDSASATSGRSELLRSGAQANGLVDQTPGSKDDTLMGATTDVQDTLQRTLQLMRQELDRSVLSTQMLEQQTLSMSATSDQYGGFSSLLDASKSLITSMERADIIDRLLLGLALLFFALVCLYILKKRILDKGLRLVPFGVLKSAVGSAIAAIREGRTPALALPVPFVTTAFRSSPTHAPPPPPDEPRFSILPLQPIPSALPVDPNPPSFHADVDPNEDDIRLGKQLDDRAFDEMLAEDGAVPVAPPSTPSEETGREPTLDELWAGLGGGHTDHARDEL